MSNNIFEAPTVTVTSFWGGKDRGPCLQITTTETDDGITRFPTWGVLTRTEVNRLIDSLLTWYRESATIPANMRKGPTPDEIAAAVAREQSGPVASPPNLDAILRTGMEDDL